jgi:tetratricopeptide (TPR) repeat protein
MPDTLGPWLVDPDTLRSLRIEKVRERMAQGDPHATIVEAEELLTEDPDHLEALFLLGDAALEVGDAGLASLAFTHYLQLRPGYPPGLTGLAIARFFVADPEGCQVAAREAAEADPELPEAWYYLGLALERLGEDDVAKDAMATANRLKPEAFPPPLELSESEWEDVLRDAMRTLPGPIRAFYERTPARWEHHPTTEDLQAIQPAISPFVDVLYLGTPPESGDPWLERPQAVRLYRGNLARPMGRHETLGERLGQALLQEALAWLGISEAELWSQP